MYLLISIRISAETLRGRQTTCTADVLENARKSRKIKSNVPDLSEKIMACMGEYCLNRCRKRNLTLQDKA